MRSRLAVLVVAPVLALLASSSGAAAKPQVSDPKGDSRGGQAMHDIVSVTYSTAGTGTGKSYVPKKLIVTLKLAGPPSTNPGVSYTVTADTDTCGRLETKYAPGNAIGGVIGNTYATFGSCAEGTFFAARVKGSVVTFEYSMKAYKIDRGTEFFDFAAAVNVTDPAGALVGTDLFTQTDGLLDAATGTGTWRIP